MFGGVLGMFWERVKNVRWGRLHRDWCSTIYLLGNRLETLVY